MSKKNILGLILFGLLVTGGLFVGADYMINQGYKEDIQHNQLDITEEDNSYIYTKENADIDKETIDIDPNDAKLEQNEKVSGKPNSDDLSLELADNDEVIVDSETTNSSDNQLSDSANAENEEPIENAYLASSEGSDEGDVGLEASSNNNALSASTSSLHEESIDGTTDTLGKPVLTAPEFQLIYDANEVDYEAYIPEMVFDSKIETMLDIDNPDLTLKAESAILIDIDTGEVLYYKNPIEAVFPASTAKLITCLVTLEWCQEDEEVTIGDEITMIASDSSKANIRQGQILTIRNLLEGMLLPSGNDAAYAAAAYVGRKSLKRPNAPKEEAILEFSKLMNQKAKELGVKNSCFKTPDGYDALGQYTTAFDMGLVGLAAAENETIMEISRKSRSRNLFVSGEDITWENTNSLINKNSPRYYSKAVGLKTGTSTMAGKCLVAAANDGDKGVLCVIMNSTSSGRFEDATKLLKYGLGNTE